MHVRCRHCGGRRTLARHPDEYLRIPRCKRCGLPGNYRLDHYRRTRERGPKARTCHPSRTGCGGYHHPHRWGSGFCEHNPNLTEADLQGRWGH